MTDSDKTAADPQAVVNAAADDAARAAAVVQAVTEEAEAQEATAEELAAAEQAAPEKAAADGTARKAGANNSITEKLDATLDEDSAAPAFQKIEESAWNPDRARDTTRSTIAYWLLALLTSVVVLSFVSMWFSDGEVTFDNLKSLLEQLLGPIIALVSAATGFYFGSQQSNNSKKT